jgi:hypothetical protein
VSSSLRNRVLLIGGHGAAPAAPAETRDPEPNSSVTPRLEHQIKTSPRASETRTRLRQRSVTYCSPGARVGQARPPGPGRLPHRPRGARRERHFGKLSWRRQSESVTISRSGCWVCSGAIPSGCTVAWRRGCGSSRRNEPRRPNSWSCVSVLRPALTREEGFERIQLRALDAAKNRRVRFH